jgi:alkylhydroperoxidase/carboxymuconolactone decarboxylase family protein YurZ
MPWVNFAQLTKQLEFKEIVVQGPGEHVRETNFWSPAERLMPLPLETGAGGLATTDTAEAVAFAQKQASAVRRYSVSPEVRTRSWLIVAMTKSNGHADALLKSLIAQVKRGVNAQSITEAQAVLNELNKTPQGTEAVRRNVNVDMMKLLNNLSKGRA